MPVACLSACQPAILSASLAETERQREEQRWARWCRGGTGEISGAQALPVKSDMTFWFCHLSPTAMSDSALRSACHPPLFSSASVSLSLHLSECLSVFFCLLLPLHLPFSFSFSFQSCGFIGKKWRCDFLEELRYNRLCFLFSLPAFLIFTLLYLCCAWLLMRADVKAQCV